MDFIATNRNDIDLC